MNKKIFIGSIIAVTVLIGVSFTSVVGYRSVTSDVKASPLFNIRCSRAIDEESEDLSCEYVGKGDIINIPLPTKNNRLELMDTFTSIIRTINDKSYDRFVDLILKYLFTRDGFQKYDEDKIILSLNRLRNNPQKIKLHILDGEESILHTTECTFTWPGCPWPTANNGEPDILCFFILFIIYYIFVVIPWIFYFSLSEPCTFYYTCDK